MPIQLNKKYTFNVPSTKECTVKKVHEQYIIFFENYIEWHCIYECTYHNEEDEDHGIKKDVDRQHTWDHIIARKGMQQVQCYYWFDQGLWVVKVYCAGTDDFSLVFYLEDKARAMFQLFKEYINFDQ